MPKNASELLKDAIAAKVAERVAALRSPAKAEGDGHSYSIACPGCQATIKLSESDLVQYRTDDEASETGNSDSENDDDQGDNGQEQGDDGDDDDNEFDDRAAKLAKSLLEAAKRNNK